MQTSSLCVCRMSINISVVCKKLRNWHWNHWYPFVIVFPLFISVGNNKFTMRTEEDHSIKCYICGSSFDNVENLIEHEKYTRSVLCCCKCGEYFQNRQVLATHVQKQHNSAEQFICPVCFKSFQYSGNMKRHMSTHSSEKPYSCPFCNKSFKRHDVLKRHLSIHEKGTGLT